MAKGKGLMQPLQPSEKLAKIVGDEPISRGQMMKKIWKYIKKHDLQSKKDRRVIKADKLLRPIFGADELNMFKMTGKLSQHLEKID